VVGEGLVGQVVTLGQQLIDDGSPIKIAAGSNRPAAGREKGDAR
jgi:hypothetical protein